MKDFLNNPVSLGDYVFFKTSGRWPESYLAQITSFTKSGIPKVKLIRSNRPGKVETNERMLRSDFVVVTNQMRPEELT